jgi:adenine-specific DNA-methyltransferase
MKSAISDQKLRGAYYTPTTIARFLADWAIQSPHVRVLEPSCGDGSLLAAAIDTLTGQGATPGQIANSVYAVEIDPLEAQKAQEHFARRQIHVNGQIHVGDFFDYCRDRLFRGVSFDAIIGNPPFIRYQNFQEAQRSVAFRLMQLAGMRPTHLTNAWVPFLVASTLLLNKHGGRLAMVIPAELLQVSYTAELREFLVNSYSRITLFTFRKLVFSGIQQEVVLLLGERNGDERTGIRAIELDDDADLSFYEHTDFAQADLKVMDHSKAKWTQYFLEQAEIDLFRNLQRRDDVTRLGAILQVDVGIVTGQNDFFVLHEGKARALNLEAYTLPIVTRSAQLKGIQFSTSELNASAAQGIPTLLLTSPDLPVAQLPMNLQSLIREGEQARYHEGYKCRIRQYWYVAPSVWTPDAFLLRQIHLHPKLVLNRANATVTDTIHRVKFIAEQVAPENIAAAFCNSLTFLAAELMGRSYGGCVLELEPTEAENLPIPLVNAERLDFAQINELIAGGKIEDALNLTDPLLLGQGLGLGSAEVTLLRRAWQKLRDRRINRKHKSRE